MSFNPYTYAVHHSPEAEDWKEVCQYEIDVLTKNEMWDLVDLPPSHKAVKSKWAFKLKLDGHFCMLVGGQGIHADPRSWFWQNLLPSCSLWVAAFASGIGHTCRDPIVIMDYFFLFLYSSIVPFHFNPFVLVSDYLLWLRHVNSCCTIVTHPRILVLGPGSCAMTHGLIPWLILVCACIL